MKSFVVGLIGSGIRRSLSPALHEQEADEQNVRYVYRLLDLDALGGPERLPWLLDAAQALGFSGLNITHPCKQVVVPYLDDLSEDARSLGAVNTVVFRDGSRVGYNTDCSGFTEGFERTLSDVVRRNVVQLGTGGAGVAVAHAALALGTERLHLLDMDAARAATLAGSLEERFGKGRAVAISDLTEAMAVADGLIHATPTGMAAHPGLPLPASLLRASQWVAEIVYFPLETELLRVARALGCRTADGGGMATFQAVGSFRLFTGLEPDPERMLRHFRQMVKVGV